MMTSWVVTTHADMKSIELRPWPLAKQLAQKRQHRRVCKMEHHGADEEDNQRAVLEEHPDAFRLPPFSPSFAPRASS